MRTILYLFALLLFVSACQPKPDTAGRTPDAPAGEQKITKVSKLPIPSAWDLVSCERNGQIYPAVNDRCFIAIRDGQIGGNTGCNNFGGEWTGSASKMKVPGVMATKMYCEEAAEQENMILGMLNGSLQTEMTDEKTLILISGKQKLKLIRNDKRLQQ